MALIDAMPSVICCQYFGLIKSNSFHFFQLQVERPSEEVCEEKPKTVCYPHVIVTEEKVPRQVCTQECKDIAKEVSVE